MKFHYKAFLVSIGCYAFALQAQAQSLQVSGTVTGPAGPLAGVNVAVKNKATGTITNFDGQYAINVQPTDTLVFSYTGYATLTEPVNGRTSINVQMKEDATSLKEVVINAGYYNTTKRESTGSISRITAKEIEKQPVNNPLAALQGRMPGVQVLQTSGVPGSGFEVRIRGQNSIMAGSEPLYIIDGVPYPSTSLSYSGVAGPIIPSANVSPLNAINPAIIESIEVLKDADATAIYGSRGANGVVLITTKKGKAGKTRFTISSSAGFAHITRKRDLLNTQQYLEMRKEAFANDGITEYPENAYDVNGTWDQNRYTDWQEKLIGETAEIRSLQAMVSGGNEQTQFLLSGMTQKETTVYPGDYEYDRITTHASLTHSGLDDRFNMSFSVGYTLEENKLPEQDFALQALSLVPNAPPLYNEEGELNWENNTWANPLARLQASYEQENKTLFSNLVLSYELINNLSIKLNTGYGVKRLQEYSVIPHTVINPSFGQDSNASAIISSNANRDYWILEPQVEWEKQFGKNRFTVLLGSTFQEKNQDTRGFLGLGFANNSFIYNLGAANTLIILEENKTNYKYHSVFGRINYAYDDKLFLNITGRRDGSSRFGPDNRYGNFGAVGAAWLFSEELDLSWLSFGKLRASYGITGNDQIGDYSYLRNYVIADYPYDGNIGLLPARHYNPYFQWEKNKKREIALELGMLQQRISTSISYYNNRSSNQLVNFALPGTTGFTTIQSNLDALVENSGWEFELFGELFDGEKFNWDASFNLSLPDNKLLEFPGLENSTYANRYVIGQPLNIVKLYKLKGVNPKTGLFEFVDYNNDGQITAEEDRKYVADLTPKLFGGFSNSLSYENWELNIFFQFVKKDGYNQYLYSSPPGAMLNQPVSVMNRWQQPGDQASMQRFTTGADPEATLAYSQFTESTGIISDASFIRLKSVSLTYSLPFKNTDTSCRISLRGQNLLTWTDFEGGDPEQSRGFIPSLRRMVLDVQLQF
jgi:TonB-linked SusC/RagA family outer membrane protein